ncbi:MAG TPA: hypothetical protein VE988_15360 [Gemmataceae bacterium]|nr:hypothetical protein [Gemmataceae bacterium]
MISAPVQPSFRPVQAAEAPVPAPIGAPGTPFPEAECEALHASDRQAATAIICVMLGIFSIGLILYTVILFTVS